MSNQSTMLFIEEGITHYMVIYYEAISDCSDYIILSVSLNDISKFGSFEKALSAMLRFELNKIHDEYAFNVYVDRVIELQPHKPLTNPSKIFPVLFNEQVVDLHIESGGKPSHEPIRVAWEDNKTHNKFTLEG